MIVAAHQTNFFPYAGIIEKARRCDRFVVLTQAQYSRGNYHNRFLLDDRWYTLAVNQTLEPLACKRYKSPRGDWEAIKRRLPAHADVLARFDDLITDSLVETNVAIIRRLFSFLEVEADVVLDYPTELTGTARLVDLCQRNDATVYLSGPSGKKYLDDAQFERAGIVVEYQEAGDRRAAVELLMERGVA